MKKSPARNEIPDEEKWSVQDLYASDQDWEKDYDKILKLSGEPCKYQGKLGDSVQNLYEALKESDESDMLMEKVYVYAFMRYYEDTTNALYQKMSGRASLAMTRLGEKYAFMMPEILEIDDATIDEFLKDEKLRLYEHALRDLRAKKEHTLSEKEEKLLAKANQIATSPNEIFSKFNNADVKFGEITDEEGNAVELTNGRFSVFMESSDRRVRKDAFTALYKQYKSYINTLAATYYANVKQAVFYAQARNYPSTLEMYLSGSFIPVTVYENLIKTVNDNLDKMHAYVHLRKKALGVSELHFYDVYAPMVQDYKMKVSYDEAKKIALEALAPLGQDYVDKIKEGFETGWVDVRENIGKRSGAFSWGAYGTHPYVFLNYSDSLNDVFTVVHEMGHAMHTYYSNEHQPYTYAGYRIFVAEVASTCNEAILIDYLLKHCDDERQRKYLINHYLEQFKGTLFRQTMFAEFEMTTHHMAEQDQVLNAETLCKVYKELNAKYFGEEMVVDEQIAYEWARIPHFYTPFYVYQYATGFSAAIAIATKIIAGDQEVLAGYKKFLSGGSSMHPIDLLKLCGVDMSKPQVIQDALDVFGNLLKEW
jgi:oligoendopeptidase F